MARAHVCGILQYPMLEDAVALTYGFRMAEDRLRKKYTLYSHGSHYDL